MDELTECLYEFLLDRRMGGLWENAEYRACSLREKLQEEQVKSCLDPEQWKQVGLLIDCILEETCLEKKCLFQAALGLVQELNAVVGA